MYVYRTIGICPPEIHFNLAGNILKDVQFVGGGCKGNAELISRLVDGKPLEDILHHLKGIQCRNGTSCPDQLHEAIIAAQRDELCQAGIIQVGELPLPYHKVAVIAELNGNLAALQAALKLPVDLLLCLGNLTGPDGQNDEVIELVRKEKVFFVQGPYDYATPIVKAENLEYLKQAPFFLKFRLGQKIAVGFYSGFIQDLEGFSDFSSHSLELLMVSNLSGYLRNEEVFPALIAMTEQFCSDLVLFAYTNTYRHLRLGKVDFINVGSVKDGNIYNYALLELEQDQLKISFATF